MTLTLEASPARDRIAAKLDAIAGRRAAELPVSTEQPITLERVGDTYSAVPARPHSTGHANDVLTLAVAQCASPLSRSSR